jgi:transcriptional regulator NrdR family protein
VRNAPEPNGEITTDQIAHVVLASLSRTHVLAFLRSAVHHRMMPLAGTEEEMRELANVTEELVADIQVPSSRSDLALPPLREPPLPLLCPRCGMQRVARRSRANTVRGLEQQPASCGNCGQRYVWEWGAQVPLLVITESDEAIFDVPRFRAGIRSAVRRLPGTAAIWGDERLVASAANTASMNATPFIRAPTPEHPIPSIDARDLWLAAASALREIHPLAFVRYALHSRAIVGLDWEKPANARRQTRLVAVVQDIGRRYFGMKSFPELPGSI